MGKVLPAPEMLHKMLRYEPETGKKKHLGLYLKKRDAIRVRANAEATYGFHDNHGRVA